MTLVIAAHCGGIPLLLGDVLLSGDAAEHREIATFDNAKHLLFPRSMKLVGFANNLVIIKSSLAIGWSGAAIHAAKLSRYLAENVADSPTLEELQQILKSYGGLEPCAPIAIVGSLAQNSDLYTNFRWDVRRGFASGPFFVEGSGSERFKRFSHNDVWQAQGATPISQISWALGQIGLVLADQILEGADLPDYFGGGFDLVFYWENRFRRIAFLIQIFIDLKITSADPADLRIHLTRTLFWQGCYSGLHLARIDLGSKPLTFTRRIVHSPINRIRSVVIPIENFDCGESKPEWPQFILVHERVVAGKTQENTAPDDLIVCDSAQAYQIPTEYLEIAKYRSSVRVKFSPKFVEERITDVRQILSEHPTLRKKIREHLTM